MIKRIDWFLLPTLWLAFGLQDATDGRAWWSMLWGVFIGAWAMLALDEYRHYRRRR